MSAQHHSPAEIEAQQRMLQEFLGNAKPRFPRGHLSPTDEGELAFAVATDENKKAVVIRFTKPVDWIGLDRKSAVHLANLLVQRAGDLEP